MGSKKPEVISGESSGYRHRSPGGETAPALRRGRLYECQTVMSGVCSVEKPVSNHQPAVVDGTWSSEVASEQVR